MFDGHDLMSYHETLHIMSKHGVSLSEVTAMLPWHLDVRLQLILRDQEEANARKQKQMYSQ